MESTVKGSPLIDQTMALCQAIVDQPDFQSVKERLDAFMNDELIKFKYQQVNELNSLLQMKQQSGRELKDEEIAEFDKMREDLLASPVAQGFFEAQKELQMLHDSIGRFVNKTFELGRKPEFDDVYDGCSDYCGCH